MCEDMRTATETQTQRTMLHVCFVFAVQLDNSCDLHLDAAAHTDGGMPVTGMLRLVAALALFCEGLAGVYIPVLLRSVEGYEW